MKELNEIEISREIINGYFSKLNKILINDVVIVGAGPSGLTAAILLAREGKRVTIFEKKLSCGGGIWGGGMMFNDLTIEENTASFFEEMGIKMKKVSPNLYVADAVEVSSCLTYRAVNSGATIMNCIFVEDIMVKENKVCGLVINWTPVEMTGLHVDPLTVEAKFVVDATGHDCNVVKYLTNRGIKLNTPTGKIEGEAPMWAGPAEEMVVEHTKEIYPGLYVTGMAANNVFGAHRMGPVFGGMIQSGIKCANEILEKLK